MCWMCPLACSAWSSRKTWISLLRKIISTKYVIMMRRLPRINHRRWFTRIGNGQTEEGRKKRRDYSALAPIVTVRHRACAFLHVVWEHVGSCGLYPSQSGAAASLVQYQGKTSLHNGEYLLGTCCNVMYYISGNTNGLIHKASWV